MSDGGMEFFAFSALVAFVGWILGVVGFFQARRARRDLAALRDAAAVAARSMLRISVRLGLSGWRLETCVPMQACVPRFLPTQRSSTSRQCASRLPGVSTLPTARVNGYRAYVAAKVAVHRGNPG